MLLCAPGERAPNWIRSLSLELCNIVDRTENLCASEDDYHALNLLHLRLARGAYTSNDDGRNLVSASFSSMCVTNATICNTSCGVAAIFHRPIITDPILFLTFLPFRAHLHCNWGAEEPNIWIFVRKCIDRSKAEIWTHRSNELYSNYSVLLLSLLVILWFRLFFASFHFNFHSSPIHTVPPIMRAIYLHMASSAVNVTRINIWLIARRSLFPQDENGRAALFDFASCVQLDTACSGFL